MISSSEGQKYGVWLIEALLATILALAGVQGVAAEALIEHVSKGSGAAEAGLVPGDRVLAWSVGQDETVRKLDSPVELDILQRTLAGFVDLTVVVETAGGSTRNTRLSRGLWRAVYETEGGGSHEKPSLRLWREPTRENAVAADRSTSSNLFSVWQMETAAALAATQGRWGEELALLRQALATLDKPEARLPRGWPDLDVDSLALWRSRLSLTLGQRLGDQGDFEESLEILSAAAESLEAAGAAPPFVAEVLVALAETQKEAKYTELATTTAQRVLSLSRESNPTSLPVAAAHTLLGRLAVDDRKLEGSARELAAARSAFEEHDVPARLEINQLNTEGVLAVRGGDLDAAQRLFAEAQTLLEASEAPSTRYARSLNNLGGVAYFRGDLLAAKDSWERAIDLDLQFAPDGTTAIGPMGNLGAVLKNLGRLDEAEILLRRVLDLVQNDPAESRRPADAHEALGKLFYNRRDYDRAAIEYDRAFSLGGPDPVLLAHMGQLAQLRGDVRGGMRLLRQAADVLEAQGDDERTRAFIEHEQAVGLMRLGDLESARSKALRSLQRYRDIGLEASLSKALDRLAEIELKMGRLDEAESSAKEALALDRRFLPGSPKAARAAASLGEVLRMQGDLEAAEELICGAVDLLDSQTLTSGAWEDDRTTFRQSHIQIYRWCADLLVRSGRADLAIEVMERLRGQSLRAQMAERLVDRSAAVPADLKSRLVRNRTLLERASGRLDSARAQASGDDDAKALIGLETSLEELREDRLALFEELRTTAPLLAELQLPSAPTVQLLASQLPSGALRLSYVIGSTGGWLQTLDGEGAASAHEIAVGADELAAEVTKLHRTLRQPFGTGYLEPSRRLGELLLQPILPQLEAMGPGTELFIVPDGPLHEVPFGALRVRDSGGDHRFLVELVVPRLVLVSSEPRREGAGVGVGVSPGSGEPGRVVAMADPALSDRPDADLAERGAEVRRSLPWARREAREIASLFEQSVVRVGEEASVEEFLREAPSAGFLHLAVHTDIDDRDPMRSALLLAGGGPGSTRKDGRIRAWELAEDITLDASLVTLAACETALGPLLEGEGLMGLMRTFRLVGAERVVASLWKVGDEATSGLMVDFYRNLEGGTGYAASLAAAQRSLISATTVRVGPQRQGDAVRGVGGLTTTGDTDQSRWQHPYYWAAFQLYE